MMARVGEVFFVAKEKKGKPRKNGLDDVEVAPFSTSHWREIVWLWLCFGFGFGFGLAWLGLAWLGLAWLGSNRLRHQSKSVNGVKRRGRVARKKVKKHVLSSAGVFGASVALITHTLSRTWEEERERRRRREQRGTEGHHHHHHDTRQTRERERERERERSVLGFLCVFWILSERGGTCEEEKSNGIFSGGAQAHLSVRGGAGVTHHGGDQIGASRREHEA